MNNKEKKVLRFLDNDSFISLDDRSTLPFEEITLRSSIGSPIAASSLARPLLPQGHRDGLEDSHAQLFRQMASTMQGAAVQEDGDTVPDSARSRVSFAPSDMTDTSLGILNLDDLASGLEELDDDFMDLSQDLNSPRSGIGDGEEMAPPQPPSLPFPSPRELGRSRMAVSQMSAPSIMFFDSQEEEDGGIASDFSDENGQATPVPAQVMRSRTQGNEAARSSEIDTEDELNAVRQEIAQTRPYIPDPADRLGVGESRDDDSDDDNASQRYNGSRDTLLDNQVPRLQLDGGSSEDDYQRAPLTEPRQSAEGEVVILDPGDGGGGGDGMSDGETVSSGLPDAPVTFGQSTLMAFQGQGANRSSREWTMTAPSFDGSGAMDRPALASRHADHDEDADDEDDDDDRRAPHMELFAGQSRVQPIGETDIWQQGAVSMNFSNNVSLPHESSTNFHKRFADEFEETANLNGAEANNFGDGAHNPFDSGPLPDRNGFPIADIGFGSGDEFVAADDAMAMLDKDQEEYEEENIFRQDEDMSRDLGDDVQSGWELPNGGHMTLRESMSRATAVAWDDEKSYGHSAERLFALRSEALGSLSGDSHIAKPHFGDGTIISPPPHPSFPLINRSIIASNHDDGDQNVYPTSQREAGVGQNTHDASRASFQNLPKPVGGVESSNAFESQRSSQTVRAEDKPENRSGVYVPPRTSQFPFGQQSSRSEKMMGVNESVSDSLLDPPEGYQTPPMDLSFLTAAIAQASSTADPQQLAKMILSASNKVAAAKEEAKQKAMKGEAAKSRRSQTRRVDSLESRQGKTKKMEQPDTASQLRYNAGSKGYSRTQEEQKPLISRMNGRPQLSGDHRASTDNGQQMKERTSLDGSGGSGQESRSSSSSRGSHGLDDQQPMERKRVVGSYEKCNSDRSILHGDFTGRESQLNDDYFAEITRDVIPVRGIDISDTIDFQDFEESRIDNAQSVKSSHDRKDLENHRTIGPGQNSKKLQKEKLNDWNSGQFDRLSRDKEVIGQDQGSSRVRHTDMYAKMEDSRQDSRALQQHSREQLSGEQSRTNRAIKGTMGPQKSQSIPTVTKHRNSRDTIEVSKSNNRLSHQTAAPGNEVNLESLSRGSVCHDVPRRRGNGQNRESDKIVEPRSQAIPDGEPTEAESVTASRVSSFPVQDLEDQVASSSSLYQQRSKSASPRQVDKKSPPKDKNNANSSLNQRNSLDGSSCRPKESSRSLSSRQRRTIDGASQNGSQNTALRDDDDVFKRPDLPVAPRSTRIDITKINGTLSNKTQQQPPEGLFDAEVDVSRFSIDSQADIILGKHRIVQTPRDRRTENTTNHQRVKGVSSDLGVDSQSGQMNRHHQRGSLHEGRDMVVDADVDSGFSSEHPHRLTNSVPQLTVSNVAHVQEMWKGSRELPTTFNDNMEEGHNFSAISAEVISPVPSPRQSPGQSPVAPSKQNRSAGSDIDKTLTAHSTNRTLVAETPDLISPRSSGSSCSRSVASSMNRSASSSSDHSCSTPKRATKSEMEVSNKVLENPPPGFVGSHHLAPPPYNQPYTSSAPTLPSVPDPTRRPVLPSYLEQPSFYTNQALSETNFLQHYVNDRPVSKLSPTNIQSIHQETLQPRSASHLGIPQGSHQPGLYLGQTAPLTSNLYGVPTSMALTGPGVPSLHQAFYSTGLGGHQQQQQSQRRSRSRSVEPHSMNPLSWPAYHHMQDTQTNGVAGLLETAVHSGPTFAAPNLGHPSGAPASIVSNLIVPFEHRFRDVACIGIAAQDSIQLQNPSARWLQCFLEVVSLSVNGEEVDNSSRVFFMRPRIIIGPYTTEEHKITFAPRQPGIHEAKIQVGSSPVVADSEAGLLRVTAPPMMTLRAVGELPEIEIDGAVKGRLDLGEMVFGMERSKTVCLINRGRSSLPVRLYFVNKMVAMWYTASITGENGQDHCTSAAPARPLHITLPGHSTTTIDGEVLRPPASITVKLTTQRSETRLKAASLGPPENVHLSLKIELDVPERSVSLADVDLCARVGVAKLHLPDSLAQEAFLFKSTVGQTTSRNLLLKNAGNIRLDMRLRLPRGIDSFEVVPDTLVLEPSQQRDILVRFTPKEQMVVVEVPLFIQGKPDGPNYELQLRGEIQVPEQRVRPKQSAQVLCNKQYISWGGIPLGKSLKKSATLRNPSTEIVSLKLTIRDCEDFQLQSSHGNQKKLSSSRQVVIKPKQDFPVDIVFSPSQLLSFTGTLDVKPINGSTKYLIPLSGYGGVSNLVLEDANLRGDTYLHDLGPLTPGQHTVLTFKVRNTGLRAAFVKALCFNDSRTKVKLPSSRLNVEPSEFVISPKMSKTLTVIFNPKEDDVLSALESREVAAVGLFCGDEVLRQLLKRIPSSEMTSRQTSLSADNPLRGVSFDVRFLGEEHCKEKFNIEPGSNTWSLFYTNMSRVLLSLTGRLGRKARSPRKDRSPSQATSSVVPLSDLAPESDHAKLKKEQTPHGIVLGRDGLTFDPTSVGQSQMLKLMCKNTSRADQTVEFLNPDPPFYIQHHTHTIRAKHFVRVPIFYKPKSPGKHQSFMVIHTLTRHSLVAELRGESH